MSCRITALSTAYASKLALTSPGKQEDAARIVAFLKKHAVNCKNKTTAICRYASVTNCPFHQLQGLLAPQCHSSTCQYSKPYDGSTDNGELQNKTAQR